MARPRQPLPTRVDGLPPLPTRYRRAIDAGLTALGLALPEPALSSIAAHATLLLAWNEAINLTAIVEPERIAMLHVIDSLTAVPILAERPGRLRVLDLGSGAGYPGLPLAAALPDIEALLVESVAKKARFLDAAVGVAGLADRVGVAAVRAEALAPTIASGELRPFDVVTARAVGALPNLVRLAFPLLGAGGRLVAWKRGEIEAEVDAARDAAAKLGSGRVEIRPATVAGLEAHVLVVVERR